jgi:transposase InsO family protein
LTNTIDPLDEGSVLARYLVVSQVCAAVAAGMPKTRAVEEVAGRVHLGHGNTPRRYGVRSIWRWLMQWEAEGLDGLRSEPRQRQGSSLPPGFLSLLKEQKLVDPKVSVPEVIRLARVEGVIGEDESIDRTTVWRECRRLGLPTQRRDPGKRSVQRPWRFPHRMQCVLADGKHFKAGSNRARRVAVIFLDNASRFILGAVVGTAESAALALRGLHKVISRWGLMSCLYVDLGFDTLDLARATASLGISLILGTRRYPEARGSLERFNRTMSEQLLYGWPGNPAIDPELMALERRIEHWAFEQYNHTPHEGLDLDTPADRFHSDLRRLVRPDSQTKVDEAFVTSFPRQIKNHNCISIDGDLWEVPLGHRHRRIQVFRNMISGELSVLHDGKRMPIKRTDLTANAYDHRPAPAPGDIPPEPRRTAADAAWDRDHPPLVNDDGNYNNKDV